MSYVVNGCVAPFCHSQDHPGGVVVPRVRVSALSPELLRAAADAIRDTGTPLHTTVAAWLDDTARDADTHRAVWELAGQDVEWLTEYRYRWALTVARAALTEAPA